MFKCCVCNKSSKKEKPNGEVTKLTPKQQNQKAADLQLVGIDCTKLEENGPIGREEKLNGDVQRFEKISSSPSMEKDGTEVVDDLTVKSPLPAGKRDEVNDNSRSRAAELNENTARSNDGNGDDNENDIGSGSDRTKLEKSNGEVNGSEDANNGNRKAEESDNVSGNGDGGGKGGGVVEAMLNSGVPSTVKTNLYDSSAYIERTIDDGPEEEGDDSVFEACPNDTNANEKPPGIIFIAEFFFWQKKRW